MSQFSTRLGRARYHASHIRFLRERLERCSHAPEAFAKEIEGLKLQLAVYESVWPLVRGLPLTMKKGA